MLIDHADSGECAGVALRRSLALTIGFNKVVWHFQATKPLSADQWSIGSRDAMVIMVVIWKTMVTRERWELESEPGASQASSRAVNDQHR